MRNLTTSFILAISLLFLGCFSLKKKENQKPIPVNAPEVQYDYWVLMETSLGNLMLKLYNETPKHRDNFATLVQKGFYDSLLFHRVIKGFMIQGGDPQSKFAQPGIPLGNGDVGYRIPAEFNPALIHKKGVLAAARDNNPEKASSGCQFYIVQGRPVAESQLDMVQARTGWTLTSEQKNIYRNIGGAPHLDNNYTVFGEVMAGIDVVDKIAEMPTQQDRPNTDIRIIKARLFKTLR